MALRDYMRELLRTKTFTESDLRQEENDVVQITIVDDNSSLALSIDDCHNNATNNQNVAANASSIVDSRKGEMIHNDKDSSKEVSEDSPTHDHVLEGFRRRRRHLCETLSPRSERSPATTTKMLQSPSIVVQWTPITSDDDNGDDEPLPRDSQRGRMHQLKSERNASPPFLV